MVSRCKNDLQNSMDITKSLQLFLTKMRSDEGVNNVITNAKELREKIGIVPEFEKETTAHQWKIKAIFLRGGR